MLRMILLACAAGALMAGGAEAKGAPANAAFDKELTRIVKGKGSTDPIAAAALVVSIGGEIAYAGAAGCAEFPSKVDGDCLRPFLPDTKFRVASISKMALAMGVDRLVENGTIDLDADVSRYLGWKFENPYFPGRVITTRHLLSHLSSVRDPEEYWIAAPGNFRTIFDAEKKPFALPVHGPDVGPGGWFEYANLNYGILAGVIEGATGKRFDLFMSETVFMPMGLDIGYNWSGVSKTARARGGALAAREDGAWRILVDKPDVLTADLPYFLADDGLDRATYLERYAPGDNPTLFSPQGGLRASVKDLAQLVRSLKDDAALSTPVWRYKDAPFPNGNHEENFYSAFGLGVQTVEGNNDFLPQTTMIGHAGEAYGVYSGAWLIRPQGARTKDVAIAFVATGVDKEPPKGAHPTFNAVEERLIRLALDVEARAAARISAVDGGPRPFDPKANATREVDAVLLEAKATGKKPIIVLGTNACHDSRGLALKFATPPLDRIIADNFLVVWIDVGLKDRNLEIANRFGVDKIVGTPTVLVVSPEGAVLNADTAAEWRTADSKPFDEAVAYFKSFTDDRR